MDVDILAQIRDDQVAGLLAELGPDWYGDPKMIRDHFAPVGPSISSTTPPARGSIFFQPFNLFTPPNSSAPRKASWSLRINASLCRLRLRKTLFSRNFNGLPQGVKYRNVNRPT
jgi:hypothetical protein